MCFYHTASGATGTGACAKPLCVAHPRAHTWVQTLCVHARCLAFVGWPQQQTCVRMHHHTCTFLYITANTACPCSLSHLLSVQFYEMLAPAAASAGPPPPLVEADRALPVLLHALEVAGITPHTLRLRYDRLLPSRADKVAALRGICRGNGAGGLLITRPAAPASAPDLAPKPSPGPPAAGTVTAPIGGGCTAVSGTAGNAASSVPSVEKDASHCQVEALVPAAHRHTRADDVDFGGDGVGSAAERASTSATPAATTHAASCDWDPRYTDRSMRMGGVIQSRGRAGVLRMRGGGCTPDAEPSPVIVVGWVRPAAPSRSTLVPTTAGVGGGARGTRGGTGSGTGEGGASLHARTRNVVQWRDLALFPGRALDAGQTHAPRDTYMRPEATAGWDVSAGQHYPHAPPPPPPWHHTVQSTGAHAGGRWPGPHLPVPLSHMVHTPTPHAGTPGGLRSPACIPLDVGAAY